MRELRPRRASYAASGDLQMNPSADKHVFMIVGITACRGASDCCVVLMRFAGDPKKPCDTTGAVWPLYEEGCDCSHALVLSRHVSQQILAIDGRINNTWPSTNLRPQERC